ncbi:hypothetical protein AVBRAN12640_09540 [Campylobacter sp. RM12640]|uniref:sugar phosphate nucleotidyltransferase n=1 Tax=unclassified Campylobacter TaxID=2593542 RepID=UPI00301469C6|nr:hypothetical protein [Campylobacter sp. RM12640]MBZ7990023.1 hypothetical protein [Campylobacter sp. RM12635]
MINILIPLANVDLNYSNTNYAKPFFEIDNETMLYKCVKNISTINDARFIFIIDSSDDAKIYLSNAISIMLPSAKIIKLNGRTSGMACSCLMAIDEIDEDEEVIIVNYDQIINANLNEIIKEFRNFDAGIITFLNIHPRYSYAKIEDELVVCTSEKIPLSKNAIAGFYYFKYFRDFCKASFEMIKKDASHNNQFFVSLALNELVLMNKKIKNHTLKKNEYFTFYSIEKIEEFKRQKKCKSMS